MFGEQTFAQLRTGLRKHTTKPDWWDNSLTEKSSAICKWQLHCPAWRSVYPLITSSQRQMSQREGCTWIHTHGQQLVNPIPLSCKSKLYCDHNRMTICIGPLTHYLRDTALELAAHECILTAAGARVNTAPSLAGQNCIANHNSMTICGSLNTKIQPLSWLHMITHQQQLVKGLVVQPQSYVTQFINNGTFRALVAAEINNLCFSLRTTSSSFTKPVITRVKVIQYKWTSYKNLPFAVLLT